MRSGRPRLAETAGVTMVEVLLAALLLGLAMSAAYGSVVAQMRRHAGQMVLAETMHGARAAFESLGRQVARAGVGVPSATQPARAPILETIAPDRLSFWTSPNAAPTYLAASAASGTRSLRVLEPAGLAAGQTIYVADATRWYRGTIDAVKGATLSVTPALPNAFAAGATVTPVEQVTFDLADGALRRNGRPIIPNVTRLAFSYDAASPGAVRVVTIALGVRARAVEPGMRERRTLTLATRIAPPNLAL